MQSIILTSHRRRIVHTEGCAPLLAFLLSYAGCMYSFQPLYTPQDTAFEPRLIGVWVGVIPPYGDGEPPRPFRPEEQPRFRLEFKPGSQSGYAMTLTFIAPQTPSSSKEELPGPTSNDVRLIRLGDSIYMDLFPKLPSTSFQIGMIPVHAIARISLRNDELEIFLSDPAASRIQENVPKTDQLHFCSPDYPVSCADTQTLRRFIKEYGSKFFFETSSLTAHRVTGSSSPNVVPAPLSAPPLNDQVRANLHIIQMALERYAVDHDGLYPPFLTGGTWNSNLLGEKALHKEVVLRPGMHLTLGPPMAISKDLTLPGDGTTGGAIQPVPLSSDYCKGMGKGTLCADSLLVKGYLSEYPANPYAPPGAAALGDPTIMHELSLGWGDGVVLELPPSADKTGTPAAPIPTFPGNFHYHPYYCDGMSVAAHNSAPLVAAMRRLILTHAVCGYVLVGFGSPDDPGADATHEMPPPPSGLTLRCGKDIYGDYVFPWIPAARVLTGYFNYEPDPFRCLPATQENENIPAKSGPDGRPDHIIIVVYGGLDKKVLTNPPL